MKVNLGVELSDEQRRALASIIAGKEVKRLASRDDVRNFVSGMLVGVATWQPGDEAVLQGLGADADIPAGMAGGRVGQAARGAYSTIEQTEVNRLIATGKTPEYARGWIAAGRVLAKSGHRSRFMRENA